jgi:hypothetical protein
MRGLGHWSNPVDGMQNIDILRSVRADGLGDQNLLKHRATPDLDREPDAM